MVTPKVISDYAEAHGDHTHTHIYMYNVRERIPGSGRFKLLNVMLCNNYTR